MIAMRTITFLAAIFMYSIAWYGVCVFVAGGWDSTEWDPMIKAFAVWFTWIPVVGFLAFKCFEGGKE